MEASFCFLIGPYRFPFFIFSSCHLFLPIVSPSLSLSLSIYIYIYMPCLSNVGVQCPVIDSSWNVMAHGDARGEVKGKLANEVGSQYPSHYLGTQCIQHYYRWCAHLGCQKSTELTPPADINGLIHFAERRNLVSAHVPSYFNWPLHFEDSSRNSVPWLKNVTYI